MMVLWVFALISSVVASENKLISSEKSSRVLKTVHEWKYFDYLWEYPSQKGEFIRSGRYDLKKMVPVDVDRAIGRTFVTVTSTAGVPASLNTVSDKRGESGPLLKPYPDWSWYDKKRGCAGIINVHRIAIDICNRLWVLDSGKIDGKHVCREKLLVFRVRTDKMVFWREIPHHAARNGEGKGHLDSLSVETNGMNCENTTVYLADALSKSLVIFKDDEFTRVNGEVYEPEERNANFDIAGEQFHMADGLGIALSPFRYPSNNRSLFYRPLASRLLYTLDTQELLEHSRNGNKLNYSKRPDVLPSPASAMVFSVRGTLFYGLPHEMAIGCYSMYRPLSSENFKIAVQDHERLQFVSGMKVLRSVVLMGDSLLVLTNRLQKIRAGTMDFNEINFRIMSADIDRLTSRIGCLSPEADEYEYEYYDESE